MTQRRSSQLALGVILLVCGAAVVAARLVPAESVPAALLGVGLALGLLAVIRRLYWALVAGSILIGVGAGALLGDRAIAGLARSSWLLLCVGGSFIFLYLVDLLLRIRGHWWPLVPGVALLGVWAARISRQFTVVPPPVAAVVRAWWPIALMAVGLWLVVRAARS